jgi:hypothetical protein
MMDFKRLKTEIGRSTDQQNGPNSKLVMIVAGAVVLLSLGVAGYFVMQYQKVIKTNPEIAAQDTKQRVVNAVGKLYNVPREEPTMARVSDVTKLRDSQEFFKNAQNGDYMLIYVKAKLAVLYREGANRIVNAGPVAEDQTSKSPATPAP